VIGESEFAAAITAALPHARHVADRWHLTKNLTDHLDKVVSARWKQMVTVIPSTNIPAEAALAPFQPDRPRQPFGDLRYQQVRELAQTGLSAKVIARRLAVSERTIQRWLAQEHGPYTGTRKLRSSPLDWATRYLRQRWEAGEQNGTVLWEELKGQGYSGSVRSVYRRLALWRDHPRQSQSAASPESVSPAPLNGLTPGKVIRWIVARPEKLSSEANEQLAHLCELDSTLAQARDLTHSFLELIRSHTDEGLDEWLKDVRASTVRQFYPFARRIEQDQAAVRAGLMLPYSTGPVEGHINRLKLDLSTSVWSSGAFLLAPPLFACCLKRWLSEDADSDACRHGHSQLGK
jgi:transposase